MLGVVFHVQELVKEALWHSSNGIGRIDEVTLCQAQLVLGWVTIFVRAYYLSM